jgi:Pyruvate/2-oxoacid:ferredoxin oxidoreductase delta subunit
MEKIALKNSKTDLKKLVVLMNKQNKRFMPPIHELLNTMDLVLAEDELDLLLKMRTDTYAYEEAAALSELGNEKFDAVFESLKRKGFVGIQYTDEREERYALRPIIVGWFEAQVMHLMGKPEEKEFAHRYMNFFEAFRRKNYFPFRNAMNFMTRLAPVSNQSIGMLRESKNEKGKSTIIVDEAVPVPDSRIYPTQSVNDLVREYGTKSIIGQFNACMCRQITTNVDDPCRFKMPRQGACMTFGDLIRPYIKYGHARQISKEEAFDNLQIARDHGAIHTVFHEKDDTRLPQIGLCNCCWDCCGILRSYNMGAAPLRYSSFYQARVTDGSRCKDCKICEKYCPTAAITVVEKHPVIDAKKCIGCGQCVHQCTQSAVELFENKRTVFLPMLKRSEARIANPT